MSNYQSSVIGLGDNHSELAKKAVENGNNQTSIIEEGIVKEGVIEVTEKTKGIITSIDGVGTKVQIYTNIFECLIKDFEESLNSNPNNDDIKDLYNELINESKKLWNRMFHDLIAMNVDDLRGGEMATIFTNIVDINRLDGIRGQVFTESFNIALGEVIKEIDIPSGNGETAVLGESQKFLETLTDYIEDRKLLLGMIKSGEITEAGKGKVKERIKARRKGLFERLRKLEFNMGGTGEGMVFKNEKLVEMKPGQRIIYFSEIPTAEGIIGARANGYTRIRELMHSFAGKNWENLTFEEFLEVIGEEKASKVTNKLKNELKGLKMWDIATGITTVYNPFISRKLLGGIDGEPIAKISSLLHITGNPLHKIANGIADDRYAAKIDMTNVKIPQILELLQRIGGFSDKDFMGSFNMGTPYAIICDEADVEKVIAEAKVNGFYAEDIGEIIEKDLKNYNKKVTIRGVGIENSTVEKIEEIDRNIPKLPEKYKHTHSGKVRETYENPDNPEQLIIIATNRISTHDVVHNSIIEGKGKALTQISNYWYNELKNNNSTKDIKTQMVEKPEWPKDFPEELKEQTVIVKKLKALPIEAIVRGYLYGSAEGGYNSETGKLETGQFVGKGFKKCSKFSEELFTPSTKSVSGDVNIDFKDMYKELEPWLKENGYDNIDAHELAEQVKKVSIEIYNFANKKANEKGYIVGDTKFEFGLDESGNLTLIDEVLTPDSSRFWNIDGFEEGKEPESSDKQLVRDYVSRRWKEKPRTDGKKYPIKLGNDIIQDTSINYAKLNIKFS